MAKESNEDPELFRVFMDAPVCGPCLDGEAGECHVPGCVFYLCQMGNMGGITLRSKLESYGAISKYEPA